jgi:hypothetical protein
MIPLSLAVNTTDAKLAIENAEKAIHEMIESNFSVGFMNDTLITAKNDFSKGYYESVIEKTKIINERKDRTYEISDSLTSLQIRVDGLEGADIDKNDLRDILRRAEREFYYENYDEAEKLIDEGYTKINDIEAKQTILKTRYEATKIVILGFVEENWALMLVFSVSFVFGVMIFFKILNKVMMKKEIEDLYLEKKSIDDIIMDTQMKRYQEEIMSKRTYQTTMSKHKSRIREVENRILFLQKKLKKI